MQFLFVAVRRWSRTALWIADLRDRLVVAADRLRALPARTRKPAKSRPAAGASGTWRDIGLTLCIALGIAAFPALLVRAATAHSSASARSSIAWALLFVAIFATCAAMIAGIARHALAETARDAETSAQLFDAAPWIAHWAAKDPALVTICGKPALDMAACGAEGAPDPAIWRSMPDIALLAAPDMAGLPPLASMLLGAGCLVLGAGRRIAGAVRASARRSGTISIFAAPSRARRSRAG